MGGLVCTSSQTVFPYNDDSERLIRFPEPLGEMETDQLDEVLQSQPNSKRHRNMVKILRENAALPKDDAETIIYGKYSAFVFKRNAELELLSVKLIYR